MTHELIHAYDYCRAELDFADLYQHACTEVCFGPVLNHGVVACNDVVFLQIRAAALSQNCSYWSEFWRGNFFQYEDHHRVRCLFL